MTPTDRYNAGEALTVPEARALGYEVFRSDGNRWYADRVASREPVDRTRGDLTRREALWRLTEHLAVRDAHSDFVDRAIVGIPEIAKRLGTTAGTVKSWINRGVFPEPAQRLAMGPIWYYPDIERWATIPRSPGRRRKEG